MTKPAQKKPVKHCAPKHVAKKAHKHQKPRGFTVVELVVVVIVIAILATVTVFAYGRTQADARDQKRKADISNLVTELDKYFAANGDYPLSCGSTSSDSDCSTIATSYTNSTGTPAPPVIGNSSTLANIKTVLPGLNSNFGDPKHLFTNPLNQRGTANTLFIKPYTYFFLSLNSYNLGTSAYMANKADASEWQTCNFSAIQYNYQGAYRTNRPHPYVVGYFSEVQNKWIYYHGPKTDQVNNLRWNYDNKAECTPVDSIGL